MPGEFTGRILHVDLTTGALEVEHPPEAFYRKYLGGSAMGMYYILQGMKPGTDACDPDNVLTVMVSLLTGAPIAGQSRVAVNARSPLVDGIGDSQAGGFFPAELRFAGFTGLVDPGTPPEPVYLWLHDGEAELRPAGHLWGKTTSEVDDLLKAELGDDKIEIAQVGPAGEKLVRLAAIINMANRANGRTGMGAVMGSKNLKAIVVRGTSKKLPLADAARLNELARLGRGRDPRTTPTCLACSTTAPPACSSSSTPSARCRPSTTTPASSSGYEAISGETMTDDDPQGQRHLLRLRRPLQAGRRDRVAGPRRSSARYGGPGVRDAGRLRLVLRRRRPAGDRAGQPDLQRVRPRHDRHRGHRRLGDGLLRERPADRGGDRLPGPVRRRRGDGPPDRR